MPVRSLKDGTMKIADAGGTAGANVITVDLEDGDVSWTERHPNNIISDRGVLDHARKANEEPVEISFSTKFQSFSTHAAITPYDALTKTGGASAWVSDEPSSDAYAVILEFTIADPAGGAAEVVTFARFLPEELPFQEGDPNDTLSISGRAVITAPALS
jgi:hypothetical protein